MRCLADEAAWQAAQDFDVSRSPAVGAFVRGRVLAAALTRYRQEWVYAYHNCLRTADVSEPLRRPDPGAGPLEEILRCALALLPADDRWILDQLCVAGRTEAEVGRDLGITRQAVSRRKRRALGRLLAALADMPDS